MKSLPLLLWALLGVVAASAAETRTFALRGTVRSILSPAELVIAHEAIPDFMPAMTMAFQLAAPVAPGAVEVGDVIEGTLILEDRTMRLADLRVDGAGVAAALPTLAGPPAGVAPKRLREGDRVPPFAVRDQSGRPRTIASPDGYTLLTFIFTRCPVSDFCPLMSSRFGEVQAAIRTGTVRRPLELLSLTIDPEFDTPELLAAYADAVGADPRWWAHAGATPAETDRIVRAFRVFRERNGALLDHTLCTALIAPDGTIVQVWRGNGWSPAEVVAAVNAAPAL